MAVVVAAAAEMPEEILQLLYQEDWTRGALSRIGVIGMTDRGAAMVVIEVMKQERGRGNMIVAALKFDRDRVTTGVVLTAVARAM